MSSKSKSQIEIKVIDVALKLAAERGWGNVGLSDIAKRAEIPFAEIYDVVPSKRAIEEAFSRRIDSEMLSNLDDFDTKQIVRERIFDVMMLRFEAIEPYRDGARAIFQEIAKYPVALLQTRSSAIRSMSAILEASGINSADLKGSVRAHALAVIWFRTFQIWLEDDADLSKTMAQLDRQLRRAESFVHRFDGAYGQESSNGRKAK